MRKWFKPSLIFGGAIITGFSAGCVIGNSIGTLAAQNALYDYYKHNHHPTSDTAPFDDFYTAYDAWWWTSITLCTLGFAIIGAIPAVKTYRNPDTGHELSRKLKFGLQTLAGIFVSALIGITLGDSISTKAAQHVSRTFNSDHPNAPLLESMGAYTNTLSASWAGSMVPCTILGALITLAIVYREYKKESENTSEQDSLLGFGAAATL